MFHSNETAPDSQSLESDAVPTPTYNERYLTESVYKVILQEAVPAQIRPLVLERSNDKELVDDFAGK